MRILKWTIPNDEEWHVFDMRGPVVHVGSQAVDQLVFWTVEPHELSGLGSPPGPTVLRRFKVVGTGQKFDRAEHRGSVQAEVGVWHLVEEKR